MVEQTIGIAPLIEFLGVLLTITVSAIIIARTVRNGYKTYIDNKLKVVDMRITNVEKDVDDFQKHNDKEHDRLNEYHNEAIKSLKEYFDTRFDDLKEAIKESKKSA